MADDVVLTDPWVDLRGGGRDGEAARALLLNEIRGEVGDGHPLFAAQIEIVGRSFTRDDVLVRLADGRWAIVHLTYKRPEQPPWPSTDFFESAAEVERAVELS